MQEFYAENIAETMKENLSKWRDIPQAWIVKTPILPNLPEKNLHSTKSQVKSQQVFFGGGGVEIDEPILKFIWEFKARKILKKKNKGGRFKISDFRFTIKLQ